MALSVKLYSYHRAGRVWTLSITTEPCFDPFPLYVFVSLLCIIAASLNEPHTSEVNGGFFLYIVCILYLLYVILYVHVDTLLTRNIAHAKSMCRRNI